MPHFLALSASSPYWIGTDTGLASARSKVFEGLPTAGLPYQLSGWEQFEELMGTLVSSGTIETIREVWWDIRPHPGFGTVELRICDGLPTLQEIGAIAALAQCLVDQLNTQIDRGYSCPRPRAGWCGRTSGGPPATASMPSSSSTTPARPARCARPSPSWSTTCGRSRTGSVAPRSWPTSSRSSRPARATSASGRSPPRNDGDLKAVVDSLLAEMQAGHPTGSVLR